jgi:hypothetical protein
MKSQKGINYIVLLFNFSAGCGGGLTPSPGHFTPGKETRYPLYRRLRGPQGWSGRVRNISPQPGFDPRITQPYRVATPTELPRKL